MFSKTLLVFLVVYMLSGSSQGQGAKKVFRQDYTYIEASNSFYKIHTIPQTWADARGVCALEGATFWHPDNNDEAHAVISFWNTTQFNMGWVYVGMSDVKVKTQFETVDGKSVSEVYSNWLPGEPNNAGDNQKCVYIYKGGQLGTWGCDSKYNFICKKSLQSLVGNDQRNSEGQGAKKVFRQDYTYIESSNSFYKIHTIPQTWADAKGVCALEGATFWHPDTNDEAHAVLSFWNTTQFNMGWVYVGMSDVKVKTQFETVDGKSVSEVYSNWLPGEPNNAGDNQKCVYIYKGGQLGTWGCDSKYYFICKKSLQSLEGNDQRNSEGQGAKKVFRQDYTYIEASNSFYKIHTIPQTWADAKGVCALEGATFWHPDTNDEAHAVLSFWNTTQFNMGWVYVGMSDVKVKTQFETVDGKSVSEVYSNWLPGEPNNAGDNQKCVYIYKGGQLGTWGCDSKYYFICKKSLQSLEGNDQRNSEGQGAKKVFRQDYTYIEASNSFYKIHTIPQTWADAKGVCALEGATFWHPDNNDEAHAVLSFWNTTQFNMGWVYVGMSDVKVKTQFETVDGKSVSEVYSNWLPGEPNNAGDNQKCVYIYKGGQLGTWGCDSKYYFICKKSLQSLEGNDQRNSEGQGAKKVFRQDYTYIEASNSFYKIHTIPQTWADAKGVCALEGATFWHPDNNDEAHAVLSFWNTTQFNMGWVYVGMSDVKVKTQFETVDGKSVSEVYSKWLSGEPNNAGDNQKCVYIYKEGQLGTWGCDSKYNFICKKSLQSLEGNDQRKSGGKTFFRQDYTYIEALKSFYKIHVIPRSWADAKRVCALEGATFWHPDNDDEAHAVISFWNTTQSHLGWVYVGMSDIMVKRLFETVEGKSVSEVYNNWQPGQPDNDGGKQDCVYMYKGGHLDDWGCDYTYSFICKKSLQTLQWNYRCNSPYSEYTFNEDNGKCYRLHTTPLSWNDSYAVCQLEQSYLAVISNAQEAKYLVNLTESIPKPRVKNNYQRGIYHVGFHNRFNEGWQTVKGTPMNVNSDAWWDNYQPGDSDQCGSMFFNGRLINTDCAMKSFFICEHEVVHSSLGLEENKKI